MGKRRDEDSSSSESDESSSDGDSDDGSSSGSSESDGSSSGISDYSTDSNGSAGSGSDDENFEVGFWQSIKAVLPWTEEAKEADYAEERLDAREEFEEELEQALHIRKMVETGMHDRALDRLMASTEGQMFHDFHKHRYVLEQSGEWAFIAPSVRRKWKIATKLTGNVQRLRAYMAMRRDRILRIRALCGQIGSARIKSSELTVTILPEDLVDKNLLALGRNKGKKPTENFGGTRMKKCHWTDITLKGEACTCTNYRMVHPHRRFRDEFGVLVNDTLATCGWHASHCVSNVHGDDIVAVSTANEGALCNECLAQLVRGPLRHTNAFGAPGVRFKSMKRAENSENDAGAGGEETLAWNKWFTKGPGRLRKSAIRPRHPHAPPGRPPVELRTAAEFVPPPPPPPVFSMANFRRQQNMAKWRLYKEKSGGSAVTAIQRTYRGYRARHERAMLALEHPEKARVRVESAMIMQSLVRRFLARTLVLQIMNFRGVNATAIQRMARGMQARALFRRRRASAKIRRQMLFFIAKAYAASARVARRIREEMRKKHAVALSLQRIWRGKQGRERAAVLRAVWMRRVGAAITAQKAWWCYRARIETTRRREERNEEIRAAIVVQSVFRMVTDKRRVTSMRRELESAAERLQPMVRGMLARARARRERSMLNQVWSWLGTDTAAANSSYARFLPKNRYDVFRADSNSAKLSSATGLLMDNCATPGKQAPCKDRWSAFERLYSTVNAGARTTAKHECQENIPEEPLASTSGIDSLRGEEHFTETFDKGRTGTCSKVEFKLGLESFCRAVGYPLQRENALAIFNRYYDGDGSCAWHSFLRAYHAGNGETCARHGRLLCALCVRHGQCEKPGCACTRARAGRSKHLGFRMCECGHPFDVHVILQGGPQSANARAFRRDRVLPERKLISLLAGNLTVFSTDRPVNVEGCSLASVLPRKMYGGADKMFVKPRSRVQSRNQSHQSSRDGSKKGLGTGRLETGDIRDFFPSSPPNRTTSEASSPTARTSTHREGRPLSSKTSKKNSTSSWSREEGLEQINKRKRLPTMQEARAQEAERRDASWAGRRGQAERAALAEMSSSVQGRNAAEYAARLQDDLATNAVAGDYRLSLAPVQSKTELRRGFAISDAVSYVERSVLKATMDPIALYLTLLKALSDERRELLEDKRRFTDFVARHAVFLERHWCKLVKDIRNGSLDPHLPVSSEKRVRVETLMIPNKNRAKKLDDLLRALGFHARASGIYKPARATSPATPRKKQRAFRSQGRKQHLLGHGAGTELTQEEKEQSMARRIEASRKKKRPGTAENAGLVADTESRKQRRTVTGGELESATRLAISRAASGARSPSTGVVQAIPTPEQASHTAYELLSAASTVAAGIAQAPSGRRLRKHVCMHPGCGKVFHMQATAKEHQEKEHRYRRRLAAPTPLTDQFMSTAWPERVPWAQGASSRSLGTAITSNEASHLARFVCEVPGCGHRFPAARLLGLHIRMGHNEFDLENMQKAAEVMGPTVTLDGLPITPPIRVGGNVSARFVGAYRVVPPFSPPSGCPLIPACEKHGRLKDGCPRCEDIARSAEAARTGTMHGQESRECDVMRPDTQPSLGLPVPPTKFFTRVRVEIAQHGRPVTLDLDCSDKARYPLLALPRSHTPITSASRAEVNEQSDLNMASDVGCLAAMIDHRGDAVGEVRVESESDKEKKEEKEGEDEEGRIEMGGTLENGRSRRSSAANPSSSSSRARENGVGTADNHRHMPTSGVTSGASREPSKSRHHQALSPARLVAVLVDGSGRGWMAAHRLWSVQDVGTDALMGAGLALEDVDQDQEFFVGTGVEYLPLSLVRATCIVKIDRKDDVHSKQRLKDLPKPLRFVSHGVDSTTGQILLGTELKQREQELLCDGAL